MLLLSVGENPHDRLRTQGIDFLALRCMAHIFGKFDVILPNMARHEFLAALALGALRADRTVLTKCAVKPPALAVRI